MNCSNARTLLARAPDVALSIGDEEHLRRHVRTCPACALYRDRVAKVNSLLTRASLTPPADVRDPTAFSAALHIALLREAKMRTDRPVVRVLDWLARCQPKLQPPATRAFAVISAFAVFLALFLVLASTIQAPPNACMDYRFGHLASFSIRTSSDGRIYAALTQRPAVGRCQLHEELDQ
jgi:hypothetical protein